MTGPDIPSDDYVAQLMVQEAKASTSKYSKYGLGAFLPKRYVRVGVGCENKPLTMNLGRLQMHLNPTFAS